MHSTVSRGTKHSKRTRLMKNFSSNFRRVLPEMDPKQLRSTSLPVSLSQYVFTIDQGRYGGGGFRDRDRYGSVQPL